MRVCRIHSLLPLIVTPAHTIVGWSMLMPDYIYTSTVNLLGHSLLMVRHACSVEYIFYGQVSQVSQVILVNYVTTPAHLYGRMITIGTRRIGRE